MQQQSSVFSQCQRFIPELSEPISLFEFTNQDVQKKILSEELSSSFNQISDHKPKKSLENDKINPYKSNWANILLNKHYKVEVTCQGNKWVIKKATEDEPSKSMVGFLSSLPKPMQNQGKLFSNTASKQTKNRLNKFIIDQHRQCAFSPNEARYQQNSSLPNLNTNKNEGNNHQNNNNIYNTKKNNKNNNNDIDEKFKPKNNIDNIIKIRLNSESPKQMPIFDINFIKTLQQFKQ